MPQETFPISSFTSRELHVCFKASKGMTNQEISYELKLSVRTVEGLRLDLLRKTGTKNTVQLIEYVFENGIRKFPSHLPPNL